MVDSTPLIPGSSDSDTKQGQRVFGCCDSRRAVIVINSVALALSFIGLLMAVYQSYDNGSTFIAICISCVLYFAVLWSVLEYRSIAVIVGMLWAVGGIVWLTLYVVYSSSDIADEEATNRDSTIAGIVIGYFFAVLMIYAECVYVSEVRKGIITRETHSREKYWW